MVKMQKALMEEAADRPGAVEREPLDATAAARLRATRAATLASEADKVQQEAGRVARDMDTAETGAAVPARPRRRPQHEDRIPFGASEQQLKADPIPGFHLHWFNDTPGRVHRATKAGYEHVTDHLGVNIQRNVGRGVGGQNGLTAYLMKIPQEWYDEDMKLQQDLLGEKLSDIRSGKGQVEESYTGPNHRVVRSGRPA